MEKIICEKCGHEMNVESTEWSTAVECPNCKWGWATTNIPAILEDETKYTITITPLSQATKEQLKTISEIKQCDFVDAKRILEAGGNICSDNAVKIKEIAQKIMKAAIGYCISPEFKYEI